MSNPSNPHTDLESAIARLSVGAPYSGTSGVTSPSVMLDEDMNNEAKASRRKEFEGLRSLPFMNEEQKNRYQLLSKLVVKDNHHSFEADKGKRDGGSIAETEAALIDQNPGGGYDGPPYSKERLEGIFGPEVKKNNHSKLSEAIAKLDEETPKAHGQGIMNTPYVGSSKAQAEHPDDVPGYNSPGAKRLRETMRGVTDRHKGDPAFEPIVNVDPPKAAMNPMRAISIIEDGTDDEDEYYEAFQHLIDTGLAWSLQGAYGREAQRLIDSGACHAPRSNHAELEETIAKAEGRDEPDEAWLKKFDSKRKPGPATDYEKFMYRTEMSQKGKSKGDLMMDNYREYNKGLGSMGGPL